MTLTTKETDLLKDMKGQEQLCITKYEAYAERARAEELGGMFRALADVERTHLQTVNELLSGKVPSMSGGSSGMSGVSVPQAAYPDTETKKADAFLCADMLTTEKHVSSLYNTGIFEFSDPQARQALNHIQTEEQQHGLKIYEYMNKNGMYNG